MRKLSFIAVLAAIVVVTVCNVVTWAQSRPAVAIMPVEEGQLTHWWGWDWHLQEGITNLIIDEVVRRNKVDVVERTRLQELIDEQDMGAEGRIDAATAARIGKVVGARLMVLTTLTQFNMTETGGIGFGPFRVTGTNARVRLTGRVVDTESGRILGSFQGEGTKTGTGVSISDFHGLSLEGEEFGATTLGEATHAAIAQYVDELVKITDRVADELVRAEEQQALTGTVVGVIGNQQIVINLGTKHGLRVNHTLEVARMQTFPGLRTPVRVPVGSAVVISCDAEAAVARIESTIQDILVGDVVTIK